MKKLALFLLVCSTLCAKPEWTPPQTISPVPLVALTQGFPEVTVTGEFPVRGIATWALGVNPDAEIVRYTGTWAAPVYDKLRCTNQSHYCFFDKLWS